VDEVFEKDIDAECHEQYKEEEIDVAFYGEVFFWFEFADSLDKNSEKSSSVQCRDRQYVEYR